MIELKILPAKPTETPKVLLADDGVGGLASCLDMRGFGRADAFLVGVGAVFPYFWTGGYWRKHPEAGTGIVSTDDDWSRYIVSDQQDFVCFVSNGATDADSHIFVGPCR